MNNNVILLEFCDESLYKKKYACLYSFFENTFEYEIFKQKLEFINTDIIQSIQSGQCYNCEIIEKIQRQFNFNPRTLPWIEFINEEFLSTISPMTKEDEHNQKKCVFTKSFYLFIDDKMSDQILNFLKKKLPYNKNVYVDISENHYFHKAEKFNRPITFCIITDLNKNMILKIEIHQFEVYFGDNSEESLIKQKNFYYFYRALEGIKEDMSKSIEKLDDRNFIKITVINNLKNHAFFCI